MRRDNAAPQHGDGGGGDRSKQRRSAIGGGRRKLLPLAAHALFYRRSVLVLAQKRIRKCQSALGKRERVRGEVRRSKRGSSSGGSSRR